MNLQQLLQLIQLLGPKFADVFPLVQKLVAAIKAGDTAAAIAVALELLTVIAGMEPAPGPKPVFAADGVDSQDVIAAMVDVGCDATEAGELVAELA